MLKSLLIANRGEIAVRIARTARRLGLRSIAVYSEADAGAPHVRACDEAVLIGPAAAKESYLAIDRLVAAAVRCGAEAVHPGYGFLSENAAFADALDAAGIVFVGPPAAAIRAMGSKSAAKALMERAGVPLVPGYHGADQGDDVLTAEALRIGFPLLVKASAGGGGKGMRIVAALDELTEALAGARREAAAAFGDDRLLLERYLTLARHVEVQVFADRFGHTLHLHERDCSLQRRHQKVVEEAPAPGLDDTTRAGLGAAAVAAAQAVGYVGAGTVEFILDASAATGTDAAPHYYFMEMNTRLQVEHPVTEAITGLDLVEWQLRVASGEALPWRQEEVPCQGHAIEVRLYAEDPARDFLPTGGRLLHVAFPAGEPRRRRVDAGVESGGLVSSFYDPMLAKLIAWGHTRTAAATALSAMLTGTEILGVITNLPFLRRVVTHPEFLAGAVDTGFLSRHMAVLQPPEVAPEAEDIAAAALALMCIRQEMARGSAGGGMAALLSPWSEASGWRLNGLGTAVLRFLLPGPLLDLGAFAVELQFLPQTQGGRPRYRLSLPAPFGTVIAATLESAEPRADGVMAVTITLDGHRRGLLAALRFTPGGEELLLDLPGGVMILPVVDPLRGADAQGAGDDRIRAPMPGRIAAVKVGAGAVVRRGAPLLVLEAMKMEHTLTAPRDGVVGDIACAPGEQVAEGAELLRLGAAAADGAPASPQSGVP